MVTDHSYGFSIPSLKWSQTIATVSQLQWQFKKSSMLNSVLRPQTSLILSTSLLFTPTQRAWFPYTWTLSSHSLLGDMRPLEFTIMIKPFPTGKGLSLLESAIDHSVFLSRGLIFSTLWVPMICCKPFIHPFVIWVRFTLDECWDTKKAFSEHERSKEALEILLVRARTVKTHSENMSVV